MAQPEEEKRCTYERCEQCPLFELCDTCYNEVCFFENCNEYCKKCPTTCHSYPDPEFESIDFNTLSVARTAAVNFHSLWFPTIRKNKILKDLNFEVVAVKFEEIYNFRSGLMRTLDLHDYFSLTRNTKIIVTFNVPDKILEKLWLTFQNNSFRLLIKGLKADYVCSPNFSNYFDSPRYQYWRNIWRSVVMANELSELNHKVIFDVSSPVPATHKFYKALIEKSNIKSLIFNCQTIRLDRYKELSIERFKEFNSLPLSIPFIINGFSTRKYIKKIFAVLKRRRVHFTSTSPYIRAICRQQLTKARFADEEPRKLFLQYIKETESFFKRELIKCE